MKKIILKINKEEELLYPCDGYILGVTNFCICFGKTYLPVDIKEIKQNNPDKKVFASLNRPIFNNEVLEYRKTLKILDEVGLDGIITGDVASLTYALKTPLILDQLHLNNSYHTINHYKNNGVSGIMLTNDITLDETNVIYDNTDVLLFKQVFGYPHLSTSNRMLVTNYLTHFNLENKSRSYEISERSSDSYYKIIEDGFGTHILGDKPLNLLSICDKLNIDYAIVDGYLLDDIKMVLEAFLNNDLSKSEIIEKKYNTNDGFINKETIYKVKNDER